MNNKKGFIIVYTGNGKGKTSAAIGSAVRAAGHNFKVFIMQFIKGNWIYGEEKIFKSISGIEIKRKGLGFVGIFGDEIPKEKHKKIAEEGFREAKDAIFSGNYDLVVLDEINVAIDLGLINLEDVLKLIEEKPENLHIILTGRKAPVEIVKKADIVSEIVDIKHPYEKGIEAVKGIDF
ncbi:cob(I)yrinic acid a,c-diamide adenosyltransferase [candidate division KSB1 bacterium]|nr:MAG: cob(I)yrinic acid a,c-diamide adenosyltransferase [candidate division KSB1 bacterium]